MRRKDREMDQEFGLSVIDRAEFGTLCLIDREGHPYAVPLSMVREGKYLYFHSATQGKKISILTQGCPAWVSFVSQAQVPDLYSPQELEEIRQDPVKRSLLTRTVFTTEYESAMVRARVYTVSDPAEKAHALWLLCSKYTPTKMAYFEQAVESGLDHTACYKMEIEEVSAKRKKFDAHREEMKWGRQD